MKLSLELEDGEPEIVVKALRNEAQRKTAYRPDGTQGALERAADQIEAQMRKPVVSETATRVKNKITSR